MNSDRKIIKVSRILHAGYIFEYKNTKIAFDPIFENPFSSNCYAYPNVQFDLEQIRSQNFTAVFISHFHDDHCSLESLNYLSRDIPIYIYCLSSELIQLIENMGFKVHSLKIDNTIQIHEFQVTARKALDSEIDSMFHIQFQKLNILNVVDSWIDDETLQLLQNFSPWDLVMWPFQPMREVEVLSPIRAEAAMHEISLKKKEQIKCLNPKNIIPSSCQFIHESWSWYNKSIFPMTYVKFHQEIIEILPCTNVIRLNPGAAVALDSQTIANAEPLNWVAPVGNQEIDYEFDESIQIPKTADIAKKFLALNESEQSTIFEYLRTGLVNTYKSIGPSNHIYFNKPRIWRLTVFDHNGKEYVFYYQLAEEVLKPVESSEYVEWVTEIPIYKLFLALKYGESLTSLYIRINDLIFPTEIEKEIGSVDVTDDPLIRCLYSGNTFAYQKRQYEKLYMTSIN